MKNHYWVVGEIARIALTKGQVAIVDVIDLPKIAPHRWCAQKYGQGFRAVTEQDGETLLMHQVIEGSGRIVDHRDGNPLNNRSRNLRPCTTAENSRNRRKPSSNTSGFKGVSLHKRSGRYKAYIMVDRHQTHLGYHNTAEEAAAAYNKAA